MIEVSQLGKYAGSVAKNPLGIIALFIVLIYGFAALVVGASSHLEASERYPLVWFLVLFPLLVLIVFAWLVSKHHQKLYAPIDFKSDEAFLQGVGFYEKSRPTLTELYENINKMVDSVLMSDKLPSGIGDNGDLRKRLTEAAKQIKSQISETSFIRIKTSEFANAADDTFEFPIDAFGTFSDLLDDVYWRINKRVNAFEYGYTWVLRDEASKRVFRSLGMLTNAPRGFRMRDRRTLDEVGISAGMTLLVSKPDEN